MRLKTILLAATAAIVLPLTLTSVVQAGPNATTNATITRVAPFTYEYTFDGKPGQFPRLNMVLHCKGDPAYTSDGYDVYYGSADYIPKEEYASGTIFFDVTSGWNRWLEIGGRSAECRVYLRDWTYKNIGPQLERVHAELFVTEWYPGSEPS